METTNRLGRPLARLRQQRNLFAFCAVIFLAGSLGCSLPRFLRNYREQQKLDKELVALQQAIVLDQSNTRAFQALIIKAQEDIAQLTKH